MKGAENNNKLSWMFLFICIMISLTAKSQSQSASVKQKSFITEKNYDFTIDETLFLPVDSFITIIAGRTISCGFNEKPKIINSLEKRALFCRLEDQVSKKSAIAMRMRLGSLDYVNEIEQKPNYRINSKN